VSIREVKLIQETAACGETRADDAVAILSMTKARYPGIAPNTAPDLPARARRACHLRARFMNTSATGTVSLLAGIDLLTTASSHPRQGPPRSREFIGVPQDLGTPPIRPITAIS